MYINPNRCDPAQRDEVPFSDMESDIDFGEPTPARPVSESGKQRFATAVAAETGYKEPCSKCNGSGIWRGGWTSGRCFACQGAGFKMFKTSSEQRSKARGRAAEKRAQELRDEAAALIQRTAEWKAANPAEWGWIERNAGSFNFAQSMWNALSSYGHLTEGQIGAVRRCLEGEAKNNQKDRAAGVQVHNLHRVMQRHAKFYAGDVTISRRNSDQLCWIKHKSSEKVVGKIDSGVLTLWNRPGIDKAAIEAMMIEFDGAPLQTAMKYGKLAGRCCSCGRDLTNDDSIEAGIGPICAGKMA